MSRVSDALARFRRIARETRTALADPASLGRRALQASLWRFGGAGTSQALRLAGNLVLTRLLAPEDFGLMAMALTLQTGLMMMTDIGLNMSVVRSDHGDDPRFVSTVWTVRMIRHAAVAGLLCAAAGLLGLISANVDLGETVYADPELPWIMAALTVTLILAGANSANLALGERHLKVGRNIQIHIVGQAVGLAAMIGFAWIEPSAWALVFGGMVGSVVTCALSHLVVPGPRMRLTLDRAYAAEIWEFGKWLMGASVFGFFGQNGDRLILAALLAPADFGLYTIARLWVDAAGGIVSKIAKPIGTAALSEVRRERPKALTGAFRRVRSIQNVACFGMALVAMAAGEALIDLLYPPAYHPVGVIVVLLAPMLFLRMWGPLTQLLLATGNSRDLARVTALRAVALYLTLPPAFLLAGPAWSYFVIATNQLWGVPRQVALAGKVVALSPTREYVQLAALVALAAAITAYRG